jgi:hypothetical protein
MGHSIPIQKLKRKKLEDALWAILEIPDWFGFRANTESGQTPHRTSTEIKNSSGEIQSCLETVTKAIACEFSTR